MFRLVLLNIVINDLEERLSNEVTVYAENHKIRVAGTKSDELQKVLTVLGCRQAVLDTSRYKIVCTGRNN